MNINDIHINPNNPRLMNDEKFKKLVASIKDFPKMMELRPIVVDDTNTILGGNMRYRALQEAGFTEIPDNWVKKAENLSEEEKKRFIIEDNVSFGNWDWEALANSWNIEQLNDWGLDMSNFNQPIDPNAEWEGMPEFNNKDLSAYKQVLVSFKNQEDLDKFAQLIEQNITPKTKSIWYPKAEIAHVADQVYVEE